MHTTRLVVIPLAAILLAGCEGGVAPLAPAAEAQFSGATINRFPDGTTIVVFITTVAGDLCVAHFTADGNDFLLDRPNGAKVKVTGNAALSVTPAGGPTYTGTGQVQGNLQLDGTGEVTVTGTVSNGTETRHAHCKLVTNGAGVNVNNVVRVQ